MVDDFVLLAGSANQQLARSIAEYLDHPLCQGETIRFSEGNLFVRVLENVRGRDVFIIQGTAFPANDNFMELLFWIDALKRAIEQVSDGPQSVEKARDPELEIGQLFADRYDITAVIDAGGMGMVYRAHDRELDDDIANVVIAQLLFLDSEEPEKDIILYINSPGGRVTAGLAIYDTMQFIKPDVQTICVGIAMSMGALLLSGGARGKRMALPNAKILIHQVSSSFQGQATDIEIAARETIALKRRLEEIISSHTGQEIEKVSKDMERDYFLTAQEANEYGLIDRVIHTH